MSMFCDAPARALPTANDVILVSRTTFRPKTSAKRLQGNRIAVLARPYAEPTQMNLSPPCRSSIMVGRAVGIAHMSRACKKRATSIAPRASQNAAPLPGDLAGAHSVWV